MVKFSLHFQHHKNSSSCIHYCHIHFVWPAVLRTGGNYLDELFVETYGRKIEVGICHSRYNCHHHM